MSRLSSPQALAESMGLGVSKDAAEVLERFARDENPIELGHSLQKSVFTPVALGVLWRLLLLPGSRAIVIAPNKRLGRAFMGVMHELTKAGDPITAAVCHWASPSRFRIGSDPDYGCRLISNNPAFVQEIPHLPMTLVVLGARIAEPEFYEMQKALEGAQEGNEYARWVKIW